MLTGILDWSVRDLNSQVHFSDLLLTHHGIGYPIVETKRPSALARDRRAVDAALEQGHMQPAAASPHSR